MKTRITRLAGLRILILLSAFSVGTYSQELQVPLGSGFLDPPESAKPRTWWHWTNSNITKEGIKKDLEWMKRAGIGGMQLADVAAGQGQVVENKSLFWSPEWLDEVRFAAAEADRLDLEMTIFSSAGWSLTGGPWVKPEQAMKKLVWSETKVIGPNKFSGVLPMPPSNEGPIRNLSYAQGNSENKPGFYRDFAVIAFPTPPDEISGKDLIPEANTSAGIIDPAPLLDDDLNSRTAISSSKKGEPIWIQLSYPEPYTAKSLTIACRSGIPSGKVEASADGQSFHTLALLPGAQLYRAGKVETISFPEVTARFYRIEFTGAPMRPGDVMAEIINKPDSVYLFDELKFHSAARIHRWEDKAGFYHLFNYDPVESETASSASAIDHNKIINLTSLLQPDGSIDWNVPKGSWTIMRFGYSLTGSRNRPAVPTGSGYEADKLSREHTLSYIEHYTEPLKEALGGLYGKSLRGFMLDSWEAGMQNWTDSMPGEFEKRRGYDLIPFLPSLAGRVVDNTNISDRVLWDFRRTLADMFAVNHYGTITDFLNRQGIKTYGEASGVSLEILEDALLCKKYVDIPMGEFWYKALHPELMYYQDVRGAASASHIYGKKLVAAEAFTGGGFESPGTLKRIGDYWFAQGVNRMVFHTSAHQPLDTKPGNTMVGTHINRNITWSELAEPFMTYLSRVSFILQQGDFVADLAYLLEEGAPSTMPIWGTGLKPSPPEGYDYDYVNTDVLLNLMKVNEKGRIILPDGMNYGILVLPETKYMSVQVAGKIRDLVKAGATIVGPAPESTPGYSGYPASEDSLKRIIDEVWADLDGISRTKRQYGKGRVFWGTPLKTALEQSGIKPDLEYSGPLDSHIDWIHRKSDSTDIWFLVNSSGSAIDTKIRFNVSGREAEIWDPSTGESKPSSYSVSGDMTVVPVHFEDQQSLFFVFSKPAINNERSIPEVRESLFTAIDGPWKIEFTDSSGSTAEVTTDTLKSWTSFSDENIRYFSGTAEYKTTFMVSKKMLAQPKKLILDLGKVWDIAEVFINNKPAGILWHSPFRADISGMLVAGTNTVRIRVTNEWTNRLIGDQKAPPGKKVLNSPVMVWGRNLSESGLTGPVVIIQQSN